MEALLNHPDVPRGQLFQEASWDDIEVDLLLQAVMPAKNRAPTCKKGSGDMHLHAVAYYISASLKFQTQHFISRK